VSFTARRIGNTAELEIMKTAFATRIKKPRGQRTPQIPCELLIRVAFISVGEHNFQTVF
jgi:hypothetical protein